jgi:hypothetical protein
MKISLLAKIYIEIYIGYIFIMKSIKKLYNGWIHSFLMKMYRVIKALNNGFWLGVLERKDFESIDHYYYAEMVKSYHDSMWNLKGFFDWEKIAIDSYFKGCRSIMVTGAGAGREVIALEKMGYTVDGFECNPDLVKSGNEILKGIGINAKLQLMPRNECPEVPGQYDGVVVGWGMYMLVQGKDARIKLIKGLYTKITENGPLLISFYPRSHGWRYYSTVAKLANIIKFVLKRRPIETGDDLIECNYGHYFTKEEIASEFHEAGFQLAH